jgi:pimeloyl-ACP methyl ester carboxylesterase
VKALVLAFTSAAFVGGSDFAKQFVAARIGPLDAGKTMAELAAAIIPALRGTKSDADGVARAERAMAAVPPETYRKAVHLLTTFDRRALLPNIKVPTLIVAGSEDKVAPPAILEKMAKAIPGAEYARLEGCGHLGPMDQPQAFNQAVENFLRKL